MFSFSFHKDIYTEQIRPFTCFSIKPGEAFNTWIHQNSGEIIDAREGVLLDNYLIACKNGLALCMEEYVNAWSSRYYIRFERGAGDNAYTAWEQFWENYDSKYGSEEA